MFTLGSYSLCSLLIAVASTSPLASRSGRLGKRQADAILPYSLPNSDEAPEIRAFDVETKRATFTYGTAVGTGPYSPTGALGDAAVAADSLILGTEYAAQSVITTNDSTFANADIANYNNLATLEDYTKLYDGEWQLSSKPTGQDPGILTNYTQDLLFSMERLASNPYAVRRLDSASDSPLPFTIADSTAINITGQTLDDLLLTGRLFYADHSNQSTLPPTEQFTAACDAYFYISVVSGDFLPLAIRTGVGNNLIYTPEDSANDWLLAKIMFNVNDFFMAQLDHFARTHFVAELSYMSAIRTMSDEHPVLALMGRFLYGALGLRSLALLTLIRSGGIFDTYFGYSGAAAARFSNDTYFNGYAGATHANYFRTNLRSRGLIDATGPALKYFPFYEDAAPIYDAIRTFTGSFVNSYYASEATIAEDSELKAWLVEANGPAGAIDFPAIKTPSDLADFLAQIGHLVSVSHHSVNLNQLVTGSGTLPFHPTALYKPIPDAKGVEDVASYLPPIDKALGFISVAANFARPLLMDSNRTLEHIFDDVVMLSRTNDATRAANQKFMADMRARSAVVCSRGLDGDGLSQGMPFVWKALDPGVIPWSLTI